MGENIPEKKHEQVIDEAMANFDSNQNGIIEFNELLPANIKPISLTLFYALL